ncbi:hypothetical protein FEF22_000135 [Texas Phoenix palm phytoplasma]|uniref:Uncharacterized protein n=1 Tax=Texas Phoenix palm phytoplasma TaxID=176709 RepID=A0ABS5BHY3_9MOLU|nr:hypothetical protein [Texas Phoenix palm phytoplasma]MBP3059200.1 hypothetical protein [Texas Phoenix palm phytoplasma]
MFMFCEKNQVNSQNIIEKSIFLNNLNVKVEVKYIKKPKKKLKREWFVKDFYFVYNKKEYIFPEIVIYFNHIDNDNPEFFLQPGQKIKIIEGQLKIYSFSDLTKNFLNIYKFQHLRSDK